jgi:hypothetical protein
VRALRHPAQAQEVTQNHRIRQAPAALKEGSDVKSSLPNESPQIRVSLSELCLAPLTKVTLILIQFSIPTAADAKKRLTPPREDKKDKEKASTAAKLKSTRREELLKQLKAVEDAIARKKSKI